MANKEIKKDKAKPSQTPMVFSPFEEMEHWFDDLFPHRFMHPFKSNWPVLQEMEAYRKGRFPKTDVIDREKTMIIRSELPGVKKEDLDISVKDDVLTIKASTHHEEEKKEDEYHRREISRGEYQRSFRLPGIIDSNKVKSSFKDGILELEIPKEKPAKRRSIKVE
ncbi:MAG: Hsp20/alpha crystallin family protein [Cocleimonas sp.]